LGLPTLWRAIIFCVDLWLRWVLKQRCSFRWEISNDMWHTTCAHVFQGDSWLLMGKSQIGTLIICLSFGCNLYFKYSNESCEPILNIYISRTFQWYKKIFNIMSFDLWNTFLKIQDSIRISTLKVRAHLGVCRFIPSHFQECKWDFRIALLARTFPCLCFGYKPKVGVVTSPIATANLLQAIGYWNGEFLTFNLC